MKHPKTLRGPRVGLRGRVTWQVIGRDGQVRREGAGPNLITNFGLDEWGTRSRDTSTPHYRRWRSQFAVGTGTGEPDEADTSLDTEVARTSSNGGFSAEENTVATRDGTAEEIRSVDTIVRVHEFTSAHNLTEFGFSPTSGGSLVIRELFRDESGTPIVITVSDGEQLKMTHELTLTSTWAIDTNASFEIDGFGTVTGDAVHGTEDWAAAGIHRNQLHPTRFGSNVQIHALSSDLTPNKSELISADDMEAGGPSSLDAYVTGTHKRIKRRTFTTAQANINQWGWIVTPSSSTSSAFYYVAFHKDSPAFEKQETHELELEFEVSWARADES